MTQHTSEERDMNRPERDQPVKVGDYVLATKYDDGDPCDHFFVGFVSGYTHHKRYLIVDSEGNNQRANGFRRAEKITADEGRRLVEMMPEIGDKPGPSLWWHLGKVRGEDEPECPNGWFDEPEDIEDMGWGPPQGA